MSGLPLPFVRKGDEITLTGLDGASTVHTVLDASVDEDKPGLWVERYTVEPSARGVVEGEIEASEPDEPECSAHLADIPAPVRALLFDVHAALRSLRRHDWGDSWTPELEAANIQLEDLLWP